MNTATVFEGSTGTFCTPKSAVNWNLRSSFRPLFFHSNSLWICNGWHLFQHSSPSPSSSRPSPRANIPLCLFTALTFPLLLLGLFTTLLFSSMLISRSNPPEVFLWKGVLNICRKFTEKHACRSIILIKLFFLTPILQCKDRILESLILSLYGNRSVRKMQLYWNHTSAWVLSCKLHIFRTPFPKTFKILLESCFSFLSLKLLLMVTE